MSSDAPTEAQVKEALSKWQTASAAAGSATTLREQAADASFAANAKYEKAYPKGTDEKFTYFPNGPANRLDRLEREEKAARETAETAKAKYEELQRAASAAEPRYTPAAAAALLLEPSAPAATSVMDVKHSVSATQAASGGTAAAVTAYLQSATGQAPATAAAAGTSASDFAALMGLEPSGLAVVSTRDAEYLSDVTPNEAEFQRAAAATSAFRVVYLSSRSGVIFPEQKIGENDGVAFSIAYTTWKRRFLEHRFSSPGTAGPLPADHKQFVDSPLNLNVLRAAPGVVRRLTSNGIRVANAALRVWGYKHARHLLNEEKLGDQQLERDIEIQRDTLRAAVFHLEDSDAYFLESIFQFLPIESRASGEAEYARLLENIRYRAELEWQAIHALELEVHAAFTKAKESRAEVMAGAISSELRKRWGRLAPTFNQSNEALNWYFSDAGSVAGRWAARDIGVTLEEAAFDHNSREAQWSAAYNLLSADMQSALLQLRLPPTTTLANPALSNGKRWAEVMAEYALHHAMTIQRANPTKARAWVMYVFRNMPGAFDRRYDTVRSIPEETTLYYIHNAATNDSTFSATQGDLMAANQVIAGNMLIMRSRGAALFGGSKHAASEGTTGSGGGSTSAASVTAGAANASRQITLTINSVTGEILRAIEKTHDELALSVNANAAHIIQAVDAARVDNGEVDRLKLQIVALEGKMQQDGSQLSEAVAMIDRERAISRQATASSERLQQSVAAHRAELDTVRAAAARDRAALTEAERSNLALTSRYAEVRASLAEATAQITAPRPAIKPSAVSAFEGKTTPGSGGSSALAAAAAAAAAAGGGASADAFQPDYVDKHLQTLVIKKTASPNIKNAGHVAALLKTDEWKDAARDEVIYKGFMQSYLGPIISTNVALSPAKQAFEIDLREVSKEVVAKDAARYATLLGTVGQRVGFMMQLAYYRSKYNTPGGDVAALRRQLKTYLTNTLTAPQKIEGAGYLIVDAGPGTKKKKKKQPTGGGYLLVQSGNNSAELDAL